MLGRAIEAVDPRLLYGIPAILLLVLAIALLPFRGWFVAAAALVLGAAVTCARARRCGALDLSEMRLRSAGPRLARTAPPTTFHGRSGRVAGQQKAAR
jgi:hypothetical protein